MGYGDGDIEVLDREKRKLAPTNEEREDKIQKTQDAIEYAQSQQHMRDTQNSSLQVRTAVYTDITDILRDENFSLENANEVILLMLESVARIPGIDQREYRQLCVDFEFFQNRVDSEGKKKVARSLARSIIFKIRALVSQSEKLMAGQSGISAINTQNSNQRSTLITPPDKKSPGFFPSGWFGGKD